MSAGWVVSMANNQLAKAVHLIEWFCIIDPPVGDTIAVPWISPKDWEDVEVPKIGVRLYVAGLRDWRISTPIQSVEVHDGE